MNEGSSYYFKPRNLAAKRNVDARLNKEVLVFVLPEIAAFGPYHAKLVSWHELLTIPVQQTIMVIAAN